MVRFCWLAFWTCILVFACSAQVGSFIEFSVEEEGGSTVLGSSATLNLQAPGIGQPVAARMKVRNPNAIEIKINQVSVSNSRFSIVGLATLPLTVGSGSSISFEVRYLPSSSAPASGRLNVTFQDAVATTTSSIGVAGTAPEFRLAYSLSTDGNTLPVIDRGIISFPPTQVNSSSTASFVIVNIGSAPALVNSVVVMGSAFRIQSLPLMPSGIEPGREIRFSVRFAPLESGVQRGSIAFRLGSGDTTASLEGTATASSFSYELLLPDATVPIRPGDTIALPETLVSTATSVGVRIANVGNGDGVVSGISILPTTLLQLSEVPILPATLPAQGSFVIVLTFSPREAGRVTGRLRIGNDSFEVAAVGSGARLLYSYDLSGTPISVVPPAGTVLFPPTQAGSTGTVVFTVENRGNRAAAIATIGITQTGAHFSLRNVPQLPLQLQPEQSISFSIQFSPSTLGLLSAVLRVNTDTMTVSGNATEPPEISGYSFSGASGTVEQMEQPSIGLTLNTPYSLPLTGTLTLTFDSESFVVDPALQFSTGGRQVNFTIARGSREAIFSTGASQIRFQTGTVAGTIILTPSFSTGAVDLTPQTPTPLRLTLPGSAPRLMSVQLGALTTASVTLLISGSATTRSLQLIELNFTPNPQTSVVVPGAKITLDVDSLTDSYFRSTASTPFGGLFQATVPITASATGGTAPPIADIVESVSATLINRLGRSNTISLRLR